MLKKRTLIAFVWLVAKTWVLFYVGKQIAVALAIRFPEHSHWTERAVLMVLLVPLMFLVLAPFFREVDLENQKPDPER